MLIAANQKSTPRIAGKKQGDFSFVGRNYDTAKRFLAAEKCHDVFRKNLEAFINLSTRFSAESEELAPDVVSLDSSAPKMISPGSEN